MNHDIQSIAAVVIVVLTFGGLLYFKFRKRSGKCGSGCGCGKE